MCVVGSAHMGPTTTEAMTPKFLNLGEITDGWPRSRQTGGSESTSPLAG
jgi:hypothetical protein